MRPQFRIEKRDGFWIAEVFGEITEPQDTLYGFEEPFHEEDYVRMSKWCEKTFKTWLTPRRARRMAFNEFWFRNKKDLDWFVLYWGGVDISAD